MIVGKSIIEEDTISTLIHHIKQKKELRDLPDSFIRNQLADFLKTDYPSVMFLAANPNPQSARYELIIKAVRRKLRSVYGLYRTQSNLAAVKDLLSQWKKGSNSALLTKILALHPSTKERLIFYERLYNHIFTITGKPKVILDIGCGLNPFSLPLMKLSKVKYYAYDLSEEEISLLNYFFTLIKKTHSSLLGQAQILDIFGTIDHLPSADICFLFKMTDVLDRGQGHKRTEEVLTRIPAKYVVISFPTRTMSGKKMNVPGRPWMEWLCNRLEYEYTILEFENEIFYVIKK